jgi:hypothetical protein
LRGSLRYRRRLYTDIIAEQPRMSGLWSFLGSKKNREIIGWLGGGIVLVIAGLWTAFVYFNSPKGDGGGGAGNCNQTSGGIGSGGNKLNCEFSSPAAAPKP